MHPRHRKVANVDQSSTWIRTPNERSAIIAATPGKIEKVHKDADIDQVTPILLYCSANASLSNILLHCPHDRIMHAVVLWSCVTK